MKLTNTMMDEAYKLCQQIAEDIPEVQIKAIIYHAHRAFISEAQKNEAEEVIGCFEFMGIKICDITSENFQAVSILKDAVDQLLSPNQKKSEPDVNEELLRVLKKAKELLNGNLCPTPERVCYIKQEIGLAINNAERFNIDDLPKGLPSGIYKINGKNIEKQQPVNQVLLEALQFYANPENHKHYGCVSEDGFNWSKAHIDCGDIAREAIARAKQKGGC